ncbi:hypothetical protein EVAR_8737_1 [Eumeta japonica]|uniref:Uncharacterized protein n=1 Tax=Eumeta variegata TaxID=151549 RepID=A0A4C1XKW1_EUMVA|nr:hypothetical protein EVAR_8737_1 [Eumeta japonica]
MSSYRWHLKKGQILSTRNRQACIKRLMDVSEAREMCKDSTMLKFNSLCLPFSEIGVNLSGFLQSTPLSHITVPTLPFRDIPHILRRDHISTVLILL